MLPDEVWSIIVSYLTLIDKILLSWTNKKFFFIVNKNRKQSAINSSINFVCNQNWNRFIQDCLEKIEDKYFLIYRSQYDRLYFSHVKRLLNCNLSPRFVYAHLFFCHRKNIFEARCKLCTQIVRWDIDKKVNFKFERYFTYGWSDFKNDVFCSPKFFSNELNKKFDGCSHFEATNKVDEIVEMFGTITIRILLSICKRILFCREEHVKLIFHSYLAELSNQIFNFACQNIDMRFAKVACDTYLPYVDHAASLLRLSILNIYSI